MSDFSRTTNSKTDRTNSHKNSDSSRRRGSRRPEHRRGNGSGAGYRRRGTSEPSVRAEPSVKSELDRLLDDAQNAPAPEVTSFAETGLPTPLVDALAAQGMKKPFAIQARTLPDALAGRDVLGRAQTGSGKTLGFGLPMLARLSGGKRLSGTPRGLVLVPTRELAKQVADALTDLGRPLGVRIATVFGGAPINRQISAMERGVDLVVATPGRLIDLMERKAVRLDQVRITVLDEADYMADLGFLPAVTRIMDATPEGGQRMLFSATLDRGVDRLVTRYLTDPSVHAVAPAASPVESMDHKVFTVQSEHKVAVAAEVAARPGRTLFFVRTKHGADRLAKQLERQGVEAAAIHGNLGQNARQRALDAFTSGRPRVLVATDVAARGIHVDDVDLVVHFDPPNDHKDYLHRSGRTARAGTSGTVVALVQPEQARGMGRLHRDAKVVADVTVVHPGHDAVREVATSGTPVVVRPLKTPATSTRPSGRGRPTRSKGRRQTAADRGRR
jgi:superfamily II DNA/RNA helicase